MFVFISYGPLLTDFFLLFLISAEMTALRLAKPLVGHNGKIYACSGMSLIVFESNGTVAWIIPLDYVCNADIAPVDDERGKVNTVMIFLNDLTVRLLIQKP